jgi:hypothetical protein
MQILMFLVAANFDSGHPQCVNAKCGTLTSARYGTLTSVSLSKMAHCYKFILRATLRIELLLKTGGTHGYQSIEDKLNLTGRLIEGLRTQKYAPAGTERGC